jgi:hypothetical protein
VKKATTAPSTKADDFVGIDEHLLDLEQAKSPTSRQEGGDHYRLAIQPIDFIYQNGMGFMEGNVVKYVTRHEQKGGKEDLLKAIHYLELLIERRYGP